MWEPTTYETIGNPDGGFTVSGWMIRRGDSGNTRDRADSIFVPMKWTPEPPKAILEIVETLNGARVEDLQRDAAEVYAPNTWLDSVTERQRQVAGEERMAA